MYIYFVWCICSWFSSDNRCLAFCFVKDYEGSELLIRYIKDGDIKMLGPWFDIEQHNHATVNLDIKDFTMPCTWPPSSLHSSYCRTSHNPRSLSPHLTWDKWLIWSCGEWICIFICFSSCFAFPSYMGKSKLIAKVQTHWLFYHLLGREDLKDLCLSCKGKKNLSCT